MQIRKWAPRYCLLSQRPRARVLIGSTKDVINCHKAIWKLRLAQLNAASALSNYFYNVTRILIAMNNTTTQNNNRFNISANPVSPKTEIQSFT